MYNDDVFKPPSQGLAHRVLVHIVYRVYPWVNPLPVVPPVNPYPCSQVGSETGLGPGKALDTRGYTCAIHYKSYGRSQEPTSHMAQRSQVTMSQEESCVSHVE
jgi:hypothetical protein